MTPKRNLATRTPLSAIVEGLKGRAVCWKQKQFDHPHLRTEKCEIHRILLRTKEQVIFGCVVT
jgi:hypothetical protein